MDPDFKGVYLFLPIRLLVQRILGMLLGRAVDTFVLLIDAMGRASKPSQIKTCQHDNQGRAQDLKVGST